MQVVRDTGWLVGWCGVVCGLRLVDEAVVEVGEGRGGGVVVAVVLVVEVGHVQAKEVDDEGG